MSEMTCSGPRVGVGVGVAVFVGVGVAVCVGVGVSVGVGVLVGVAVDVGVAVSVGVAVWVGVSVAVRAGARVGSIVGSSRAAVSVPQAATSVLSPASRRKVRRLTGRRSAGVVIEWGASYCGLRATAISFSLSPLNSSRS